MDLLEHVHYRLRGTRLDEPMIWLRSTLRSPSIRPLKLLAAKLGICPSPDFLIIGAQKGGTTSLYSYMIQHPNVRPALKKEVHYFDLHYRRGWDWYLGHFPIRKKDDHDFMTGEASPYYLAHPQVPSRVAESLPGVKLIVLLRNPVERAYSHYQHNMRLGYKEPLSFEEALAREQAAITRWGGDSAVYDSLEYRLHSYLSRGVYVEQLKRWMQHFPRSQFLILKSENFYSSPATVFASVLDFLGLPPWQPETFSTYNAGDYREKRIGKQTRAAMQEFFLPYNIQLGQFLGMSFEGWSQ